jgi:hypothetical protein
MRIIPGTISNKIKNIKTSIYQFIIILPYFLNICQYILLKLIFNILPPLHITYLGN